MRMRPFRTVLKAAYEVDWGDKYDEASIPEREVVPIKLFDMKQYVKEEKRRKAMDALNAVNGEEALPTIADNPKHKPIPNPFGFSDPFGDKPVDIDELVKSIDAQIAELEKEQKEEAEKRRKAKSSTKSGEEDPFMGSIDEADSHVNNVVVDNSSVVMDNHVVTDDEFFDDFFDDN